MDAFMPPGLSHYTPETVLEEVDADILLKGRVYFVHFPYVYCYDENRTIFCIGEGLRYHRVTTIVPNPPELLILFEIEGKTYEFDQQMVLWGVMGKFWLPEVTYPTLNLALIAITEYIDTDNSHIAIDLTNDSLNSGFHTPNDIVTQDTKMIAFEEDLQVLPRNPSQEEIDGWINNMKQYRAMKVKAGMRILPIYCPIPTCGKHQRRPEALRNHLYSHFDIKPYKFNYGCPLSFETETNKNRHLETCPMIRGPYYD